MASFGAKRPKFAPFAGVEPDKALPTYGEAVALGKMIKADLTVNNTKGELYADDMLAESIEEFASGTLALETDDMELSVGSKLYSCAYDEQKKELVNAVNDNAPYVGLSYYKVLKRKGATVYKGYFFPKSKAALGNDNAATRGSSITFGTTPIPMTIFAPNLGNWRYMAEFPTEAEVIAWCDGKLSGKVTPGV